MATTEELKGKELEETRRHNRREEKLGLLKALVPHIGIRKNFNDPTWYLSPDSTIGGLLGKLSFSEPVGIGENRTIVSTCLLEYVPTLGPIYAQAGGLGSERYIKNFDASLEDAFRTLRRNNVSTNAFTRGEYALYHYGKMFCALLILEAVRILAVANMKYSKINKGEPYGILRAMNYDISDLIQNYYVYVKELNYLIVKFNSYADMPESNIMKRWAYLAGSIIKDHSKSHKNQFYLYQSQLSYILDTTNGSLEPTVVHRVGNPNESADSYLQIRSSFQELLNVISAQLAAFSNSTTMSVINGNISRAVGDNGFRIEEIKNDGNDLEPNIVTHDEVLCQIQNTEFVVEGPNFYKPTTYSGSWGIKTTTDGTSLYYPKGRNINSSYYVNGWRSSFKLVGTSSVYDLFANEDMEGLAIQPDNAGFYRDRHVILSDYNEIPTKESVTVLSRNKIICTGNLDSCDSIVCIGKRFSIYANPIDALHSNDQPLLLLDRSASYTKFDIQGSTGNPEYLCSGWLFIEKVMSQFDWYPIHHVTNVSADFGDSPLASVANNSYTGEIDTWSFMLRDYIDEFNEACMMNELAIPDLPKSSKSI